MRTIIFRLVTFWKGNESNDEKVLSMGNDDGRRIAIYQEILNGLDERSVGYWSTQLTWTLVLHLKMSNSVHYDVIYVCLVGSLFDLALPRCKVRWAVGTPRRFRSYEHRSWATSCRHRRDARSRSMVLKSCNMIRALHSYSTKIQCFWKSNYNLLDAIIYFLLVSNV